MIRRGDTFKNDQFKMIYVILDFLPGNKLSCEYTRNGHTITHTFEANQLLKSLTNTDLFYKV